MSIFSYLLFCNTNKPLKIGNFKGEIWRKSDLLLSHKFLIWKYGGFDSSLVVSHHRAGIALRTLSLVKEKRSRWLHAIVLNWCTEWDVNVYIYNTNNTYMSDMTQVNLLFSWWCRSFCTLQNIPEKRRRWLQGILDCKHLQVSVCTRPICIYK